MSPTNNKETALIPKHKGLSFYPPVMNHARIADRSPGDQNRHPAHSIVDHLPAVEGTDGVSFGFAVDFDADHQFVVSVGRILGWRKLRLINRGNPDFFGVCARAWRLTEDLRGSSLQFSPSPTQMKTPPNE
jgi:hypothetical protein